MRYFSCTLLGASLLLAMVPPPAAADPAIGQDNSHVTVDMSAPPESDASGKAMPARLSAQDRRLLDQVTGYFNALRTLKADVLQYGPDGSVRSAQLTISRPGKMRLAYEPPVDSLLVADGEFLNFWDADMKESSSTPIGNTLAAFLLRDHLSFSGDITVTAVRRLEGMSEVTLARTDAPEEGDFTLVFENRPFQLRQWRVRDAEGNVTTVSLDNIETNVPVDPGLFHYVDPRFAAHK